MKLQGLVLGGSFGAVKKLSLDSTQEAVFFVCSFATATAAERLWALQQQLVEFPPRLCCRCLLFCIKLQGVILSQGSKTEGGVLVSLLFCISCRLQLRDSVPFLSFSVLHTSHIEVPEDLRPLVF